MAGNKKIFDLPLRTGITSDDRLAIVDSGNTTTYSVKVSDLRDGTGVNSLESLTGDITFSGTNIDITTSGQTIYFSGSTGGGGGGTSLIVDGTGTESIKTNSTGNAVANDYSVVLGGQNNSIAGPSTNFGGNGIFCGTNNNIGQRSDRSVIAGGDSNIIISSFAWDRNFIAAGNGNDVGGANSFASGSNNYSASDNGGCFGGSSNDTRGYSVSIIVGGENNINTGAGNGKEIFGGANNTCSSSYSTLLGGNTNTISGTSNRSVVIGGQNNSITGYTDSVVIGGNGQTALQNNEVVMPNVRITNYASLNYADDTAAAAAGILLGQVYHNNGDLRIRIT